MSDRDAILARRRRFIALALAGGAAASTASCGPCLSTDTGAMDGGTTELDAGLADATPCLSIDVSFDVSAKDSGPPIDAASLDGSLGDAGSADAELADASPTPCLFFSPPEKP